ncbi:hypothetical protein [Streptosporangium sp. NPDC048865]|uniref:hypothetical protein n=1 Tax=Streptosporangium sp. NPDC048865 TaxID=3155766 RepID=UPI00342881E7
MPENLPVVPPGNSGPPEPPAFSFSDRAFALIVKAIVAITGMIILAWLISHGFDPSPMAGVVKPKL